MKSLPHKRSRTMAAAAVVSVSLISFLAFRIETSSAPMPFDRLLVTDGWADERSCAECHEQAKTFWDTGHARTLRRADEKTSQSLLHVLENVPAARAEGTSVSFVGAEEIAVNLRDGVSREAELNWCFGSGQHAHTWVSTLADSHGATDLLEFRWTWYGATGEFGITPGQSDEMADGHFGGLGVLYDQPKARRCVGCHASHVPVDSGRILEDKVRMGVTCQRCHGPRQNHIDSGGEVIDLFWKNASQMDSVNRCAECHRRAEEQDPSEITPDNADIVRFQPVGLTQSACFQGSKMTCVTCHDPHRPMKAQDSAGSWQCMQCHGQAVKRYSSCSAGHIENCVRCHMPKVSMNRLLRFTDHWIRVRRDDELSP